MKPRRRALPADHSKITQYSWSQPRPDSYTDEEFVCQDCGKEEVWTASQQRWWYEQAGGHFDSTAKRCLACRRAKRVSDRESAAALKPTLQRTMEKHRAELIERLSAMGAAGEALLESPVSSLGIRGGTPETLKRRHIRTLRELIAHDGSDSIPGLRSDDIKELKKALQAKGLLFVGELIVLPGTAAGSEPGSSTGVKKTRSRFKIPEGLPAGAIPADQKRLVSRSVIPRFPLWYEARDFSCADCGKSQTWTARQQRWWYEVAGGEIETVAIRCRECRRAKRDRDKATTEAIGAVRQRRAFQQAAELMKTLTASGPAGLALLETPVTDLAVNNRIVETLVMNGVRTLGDLIALDPGRTLPWLHSTDFRWLKRKLAARGLRFLGMRVSLLEKK